MTEHLPGNAHLLEIAKQAAYKAGAEARRRFSQPRSVSSKGPRDVVTDADLAAQTIITDLLRAEFPDHGFLAEEEDGQLPTDGPILWAIDPIDGTVNYSRGLPIFCVSIAALSNEPPLTVDNVLAAAVYDPMLDEMFTAVSGGPALLEDKGLHGRPLQVSSISEPPNALVGIDWALDGPARQQGLELVQRLTHEINVFRALGSATLAMVYVAAGRLDAYVNFQLRPWDVAAAALIVRQAGGRVADSRGKGLVLNPAGMDCLVSNANIIEHLV